MVWPLIRRLPGSGVVRPGPAGWSFLLWWVIASLVSYSVGFPAGLALGRSLLWGWLLGGGVASLLQWALLRRRVDRAGWWILLSVLGLTIGSGLSFLVSQYLLQLLGLTAAFASAGAAVGLGIGASQWSLLWSQFRKAGWWVLASAAGYCLGVLAAVNAPVMIPAGRTLIFGPEFGGLIGLVSGAATGAAMLWLLRHPIVGNTLSYKSSDQTPGRTR